MIIMQEMETKCYFNAFQDSSKYYVLYTKDGTCLGEKQCIFKHYTLGYFQSVSVKS